MWTEATAAILLRRAQLTARCADDVRAGDVDDVRIEFAKSRRTRAGMAIGRDIRTDWDRHGRNADEVAGWREGRVLHGRRIDADLRALPQQIFDEPVERLVGAVADVIVIPRKKGNAEVARLHGRAL